MTLHVYQWVIDMLMLGIDALMQSFARKALKILGLKDAGYSSSSGQPDDVVPVQGSLAQQPTKSGSVKQTYQLPPWGQVKLQFCEP